MEVDKNETLRYLEYKKGEIPESIDSLIDDCIMEIKRICNWKYVYKIFNIEKSQDAIKLKGSNLIFQGRDILEHLKDSYMCAVMAVTLGNSVDTKIRYYEKVNLTRSLILDACASTAIEWACDKVQEEIKKEAQNRDLGITYRYSPGYGDFSIDIQPKIINVLEAQKTIGLTVTENNIMIPRKSVSAVIGFQDKNIIATHPSCSKCNNAKWCQFRKGGNYCGA